jgi:uncharacterized protein YndB with AHSA1/START domain
MGMAGSFVVHATIWLHVAKTVASATMQLHEDVGALRRETILDAPRDAVWELVAEPDGLAGWLADDVDLPAVEPGAQGTVLEDGELRRVTIEEVQDGRRVALSWCAPGGEPSLVELTLDDAEDGRTRMVIVELPLVALRVATRQAVGAWGTAPRGPQMAAV